MRIQYKYFLGAVVLVLWFATNPVQAQDETQQIDGWVGLDSSTGHGWLAVQVDYPETMALSGVVWYNNDGNVVFPKVSVAAGNVSGPGNLTEALDVHGPVSGLSSDFSEVLFDQPVAASLGGVFVVFEFPQGSQFTGFGQNGGAAFGCLENEGGVSGWISGDGEYWLRLDEGQNFAVEAILVTREEGMAVKSMGDVEAASVVIEAPYLTVGPNPFNPRTELKFGIPAEARVSLDVYDIRGAKVATLVDQVFPSGRHSVFWEGRDGTGRQMACGAYFVRMSSSDLVLTKRVLLLK